MKILGLNFFADTSAALIVDNNIVATPVLRIKHFSGFPDLNHANLKFEFRYNFSKSIL